MKRKRFVVRIRLEREVVVFAKSEVEVDYKIMAGMYWDFPEKPSENRKVLKITEKEAIE